MSKISSKNLQKSEKVRFTKKTLVYNNENATQFFVESGTEAIVLEDKDVGPIGSALLSLKKSDGSLINIKTNDENLELVK
jgi:hypothetical protein